MLSTCNSIFYVFTCVSCYLRLNYTLIPTLPVVTMPKQKQKKAAVIKTLVQEFKGEGIECDGEIIMCRLCGIKLAATKFQINQHLVTGKHNKRKSAKMKQNLH